MPVIISDTAMNTFFGILTFKPVVIEWSVSLSLLQSKEETPASWRKQAFYFKISFMLKLKFHHFLRFLICYLSDFGSTILWNLIHQFLKTHLVIAKELDGYIEISCFPSSFGFWIHFHCQDYRYSNPLYNAAWYYIYPKQTFPHVLNCF